MHRNSPRTADYQDLVARPCRRLPGRPPEPVLEVAPELLALTEEPGFYSRRVARLLGVARIPRQVTGSWRLGRGYVSDNETNRRRLERLASLLGFEGAPFRRLR